MKTTEEPPAAGEAAHLETPWHFKKDCGRYEIWPKDRGHVHCFVGTVQRKEDAAFIVRACNSHAALVAALDHAEATVVNLHCGLQATAHMDPNDKRIAVETGRVVNDLIVLRNQLRAALATA